MMNNVPLPMKSPAGRTPQKAYKHVKFMPLAHVRRVVDIRDNEGKQCFVGFPMFSANRGAAFVCCLRLMFPPLTRYLCLLCFKLAM